jgi:hypothetical protein
MESKIQREVRCVSESGVIKFIPENLVKKPGFLSKHRLAVQDIEKEAETFETTVIEPEEDITKEKPETSKTTPGKKKTD